ncbi:glycosyltransferase [Candidatus Roizmanbacteria bacterium]|nr:glycosyltransferase [Candidatus Roizmanbacteria bacterium]
MKNSYSGRGECKVTCIVPFYNESERILGVLEAVSKVKEFSQIICVDDGSNDKTYLRIRKFHPFICLIRFQKNRGKTTAIERALTLVNNPLVFCIDGDLLSLQPNEIRKAIKIMQINQHIAMIILCRIHTNIQGTWQRANNIFSGERILRAQDLKAVLKNNPKPVRYQIEVAINKYMMEKEKEVYWIPSSAINYFKRQKYGGLIKGELRDLQMHYQMIQYIGFINYLKQVLFFCRKQYHPSSLAN